MAMVIETITKYRYTHTDHDGLPHNWIFRVWRSEDKPVVDSYYADIHHVLENAYDWEEAIEEIAKLVDVNAVEVVDRDGNGCLIYPDWP